MVKELVVDGYCFKCKKKVAIKGAKQVKLKNGRAAVKGTCSVCGGSIFKLGGVK